MTPNFDNTKHVVFGTTQWPKGCLGWIPALWTAHENLRDFDPEAMEGLHCFLKTDNPAQPVALTPLNEIPEWMRDWDRFGWGMQRHAAVGGPLGALLNAPHVARCNFAPEPGLIYVVHLGVTEQKFLKTPWRGWDGNPGIIPLTQLDQPLGEGRYCVTRREDTVFIAMTGEVVVAFMRWLVFRIFTDLVKEPQDRRAKAKIRHVLPLDALMAMACDQCTALVARTILAYTCRVGNKWDLLGLFPKKDTEAVRLKSEQLDVWFGLMAKFWGGESEPRHWSDRLILLEGLFKDLTIDYQCDKEGINHLSAVYLREAFRPTQPTARAEETYVNYCGSMKHPPCAACAHLFSFPKAGLTAEKEIKANSVDDTAIAIVHS